MREILSAAAVMVAVATVSVGIWVWASAMEAKAFNELTGAEVTTRQAMFVELRVVEPWAAGNLRQGEEDDG